MQLEHEFVVPVPIEKAWDVLLDVEKMAPCMPGAAIDEIRGDEFDGRVKVKVGPITVTYSGTASFIEKDESARRITIKADGKEAKGSGTAAATILAVLKEAGDETTVHVTTDLAITGRPAQFGRGVMIDVSNKLLQRFADCLSETISPTKPPEPEVTASNGAAPTETAAPSVSTAPATPAQASRPRSEPEAIDLFETAGAPVLKRLGPALGGVALLLILFKLFRRNK
jgi:carbon monoxide dehydrogenase subunit G